MGTEASRDGKVVGSRATRSGALPNTGLKLTDSAIQIVRRITCLEGNPFPVHRHLATTWRASLLGPRYGDGLLFDQARARKSIKQIPPS